MTRREQLLNEIWGLKLRQKIERNPAEPEWLITVHGVGYKFDPFPTGPAG